MGHLDRGRPRDRVGRRVHAVPGAPAPAAHADRASASRSAAGSTIGSRARCPAFTFRHRALLVGPRSPVRRPVPSPARRRIGAQVDPLSNIDPHSRVSRATCAGSATHVMDLNVARVWIHLRAADRDRPRGAARDRSVPHRARAQPRGHRRLGPDDAAAHAQLLRRPRRHAARRPRPFARPPADVEQLLLAEPDLRTFIDANGLADLQLTVLFRDGDAAGYRRAHRAASTTAWQRERATARRSRGARDARRRRVAARGQGRREPRADACREPRAHRRR